LTIKNLKKQGNFEKIVNSLDLRYLFNGIRFSLSPLRHGNSCRSLYVAFSVTTLIGLVTLTFDLLASKYVHGLLVQASILTILGFLGLSFLELGRCTRQTNLGLYGQTDRQTDIGPYFINAPHMEVGGIINPCNETQSIQYPLSYYYAYLSS